jgi:hypothetical protein
MSDLPSKANEIWEKMMSFIVNLPKNISGISLKSLLRDKKWVLLILGCVALILILSIAGLALGGAPNAAAISVSGRPPVIPSEELFLPEEPDFLPEIMLDRERKEYWSSGDIDSYWKDPKEMGEELWKDELGSVIDRLLEVVQ